MPAVITCPSCQRRLLLAAPPEGKEVCCSSCGKVFRPRPEVASDPGMARASEIKIGEMFSAQPAAPLPVPPVAEPAVRPPEGEEPILDALPATPPPRRRKRWLVAGAIAPLALCIMLMALAGRSLWQAPLAPIEDDPELRRLEIRGAFQGGEPVAGADGVGIRAVLKSLGEGFVAGDSRRIVDQFDPERMFDELIVQDVVPRPMLSNRQACVREMRRGLSAAFAKQAPLLAWTSTDVRSMRRLGDKEAVIIARHRTAEGDTLKFRWFFSHRSGQWRIYDSEDLDVGMRMSATMGLLMQEGPNRVHEMARANIAVRDALLAIVQEDPDAAEKKLKEVANIRLPRPLEAVRLLTSAKLHMLRGQHEEAIEVVQQARKLQPEMPILDLVEGMSLNYLGKWDKALPLLETYRDLLGDDDVVGTQVAIALRGVRRFPDAAAAYRKALDYNPKNADALLGLLLCLTPQDRRDDIPARFARLDKPQEQLATFFEDLEENKDATGLEQIAQAVQQLDPDFALADYYVALARAWAGKADEAMPPFRAALKKEQNVERRRSWSESFYQAMSAAGKALEAYAGAPDARDAFLTLAAELKKGHRTEDLQELAAVHARKHANDPWLLLYQGEVLVADEAYAHAEKKFTDGLARVPAGANLEMFRASRVLARYHTGRPLSAYEDIGPQHATFAQLSQLFLLDRKHALLQKLLDTHTRNDPSDPDLARFGYRLKLRQDKLKDAVALFKTVLAKQVEATGREEILWEFLREMLDLGKPLEAYREAPEPAEAFALLAEELVDAQKLDELRLLVEAHRARQPEDILLFLYAGELHEQKQEWAQAAQVLGEGWKKAAPEKQGRFRWRYVNALYRSGQHREAYGTVEPRKETFEQLAHLLISDRRGADLEALIALHRPESKDGAELLFLSARAKIVLQRPDEATALFAQAYQKQPADEQRRWYVEQFIREMQEVGKGLDAYQAAPDRKAAFETLAAILHRQKKPEELRRLLQMQANQTPQSSLYLYYSGEDHLQRGELAEANRFLGEALTRCDPQHQWLVRNGLYRARVRAGKTVETYQEFRGDKDTFDTLARACVEENDARQLQELLANRRASHPDDAGLPSWDLEVRWLNKDYPGIVKLIAEQRTGPLSRPRFRWKRDDYLIRSLVRLNRGKEAVAEAQALKERDGNLLLLVLAHAAQGNASEAIAAMPKGAAHWPRAEDCYRDNDLGPILRSDALRPFREKYPEPKEPK